MVPRLANFGGPSAGAGSLPIKEGGPDCDWVVSSDEVVFWAWIVFCDAVVPCDGDPTRRGRVPAGDVPADDEASLVGCGGSVFPAGGADFAAGRVDCPFRRAIDVDGLAEVVFGGSADSSAGRRALLLTANELS